MIRCSKLFILLLILLLLASCTKQFNSMPKAEQAISFDDTCINSYVPLYLNNTQLNMDVVELSKKILDGKLFVRPNLEADVIYDINNIDWEIKVGSSPNTYSLYLQSLSSVYVLTEAYFQSGDSSYLEYGNKFLDSWDEYSKSNKQLNRYT